MTKREIPKLFEDKKIRTVWDDEQEKWYFSIVDVVGALTDQPDSEHSRNYWKVLKHRLKNEGNETVTNCNRHPYRHYLSALGRHKCHGIQASPTPRIPRR